MVVIKPLDVDVMILTAVYRDRDSTFLEGLGDHLFLCRNLSLENLLQPLMLSGEVHRVQAKVTDPPRPAPGGMWLKGGGIVIPCHYILYGQSKEKHGVRKHLSVEFVPQEQYLQGTVFEEEAHGPRIGTTTKLETTTKLVVEYCV